MGVCGHRNCHLDRYRRATAGHCDTGGRLELAEGHGHDDCHRQSAVSAEFTGSQQAPQRGFDSVVVALSGGTTVGGRRDRVRITVHRG